MTTIMCPGCSGPVIKDLFIGIEAAGTITLATKCPHCKRPLSIKIERELVDKITINGKVLGEEDEGGERSGGSARFGNL